MQVTGNLLISVLQKRKFGYKSAVQSDWKFAYNLSAVENVKTACLSALSLSELLEYFDLLFKIVFKLSFINSLGKFRILLGTCRF